MAWQGTLARVLGRPCEVSERPQGERQTPMDKIDAIDRIIRAGGFVNTVNFVNRGPEARLAPQAHSPQMAPTTNPAALLAEALGWPVLAQRAAVALAVHHQAWSHDGDAALVLACCAVAVTLAQGGELAAALLIAPLPPAVPQEANEEVRATTARLVVSGWEPAKAALLVPALVARRVGLEEPEGPASPGEVMAVLVAGVLARGVAQGAEVRGGEQ